MNNIIAQRLLRQKVSVESLQKQGNKSLIFFHPADGTSGIDAVKSEFQNEHERLSQHIPEALEKAELTGATKFMYIENPAQIPVTFITNGALVDDEGNIFNLHIQVGPESPRQVMKDEQQMVAAAKRIPYFKNRKRAA